MNEGIITLGSNVNAEKNIAIAKELINNKYEIIDESDMLITLPRVKGYKYHFLNQAIKIQSDEYYADAQSFLKNIEMQIGRIPEDKSQGLIPIDIDIVFWNKKAMRSDYEEFDFARICIDQIKDKTSLNKL